MRLILGMVLGIALALGVAFFHDNNVPTNPPSPRLTERQIVNWDVLGAVLREQTTAARRFWEDMFGR
jgi:hypothetical protein